MYYNNKRLALTVFWIVLGAVLVVLTVTEVLDSSIYSGMGGALMAVGTLQLIRTVKYRKDSEYREKDHCDDTGGANRSACTFLFCLSGFGHLLGSIRNSEQKILMEAFTDLPFSFNRDILFSQSSKTELFGTSDVR